MGNENVHSPITPESILASIKEIIAISRAEADRRAAEADRKTAERAAEADRRAAEADRKAAERAAEADKEIKALRESIKQVNQQIGGMCHSNGEFAEEFFYNAFLNGRKNIFGEEFDDVVKNNKVTINKGYEDEYDILLVNGRAVCVIEVKYKADSANLPQKILRKAQTFRVNFPHHINKTVYLALAGMSFNMLTEQACRENGIAIIKQVGDTVAIYDDNLKTF